jgi:hypothetical protein
MTDYWIKSQVPTDAHNFLIQFIFEPELLYTPIKFLGRIKGTDIKCLETQDVYNKY